jgi:hypothetical protein
MILRNRPGVPHRGVQQRVKDVCLDPGLSVLRHGAENITVDIVQPEVVVSSRFRSRLRSGA